MLSYCWLLFPALFSSELASAEVTTATYEMREKAVGITDFSAYYCAYIVFAKGHNPYNANLLQDECAKLEQATTTFKLSFMYPPWLLPILSPVLSLDFRLSAAVWYICNCLFLVASGVLIWKTVAPNRKLDPFLCGASSIIFPPAFECLEWGQISLLLSFAFALFLWAFKNRRDYLVGIAIVLLLMKFHLFLVLLPFVLFEILKQKRYRILFSTATLLFTFCLICELQSPGITLQWLYSITTTNIHGTHSRTSSISGILGHLSNSDYIFKITPLIGLFLAFYIFRKPTPNNPQPHSSRLDISYTYISLAAMSLIFAPYAWFHDFSTLQAIQVAAVANSNLAPDKSIRHILLPFILLQLFTTTCSILLFTSQHQLSWYPFAMLYLWNHLCKTQNDHQSPPNLAII